MLSDCLRQNHDAHSLFPLTKLDVQSAQTFVCFWLLLSATLQAQCRPGAVKIRECHSSVPGRNELERKAIHLE